MQQPSVGRNVHYVSHGTPIREDGTQAYQPACRAAIITAVHDMDPVPEHGVPYVDLAVLNPTGMFFNQDCLYAEDEHPGGTWHWPERVEDEPRVSKTFNEIRGDLGLPPLGRES